jgi:hypothetical protein
VKLHRRVVWRALTVAIMPIFSTDRASKTQDLITDL